MNIGYNSALKGFLVYNLQTKKLIISRGIKFDKNAMHKERVEMRMINFHQTQADGGDVKEIRNPSSPLRFSSSTS